MIPYWILFGVPAFGSLFERPRSPGQSPYPGERVIFFFAIVLVCLLVGLRYQVGGDWNTYLGYMQTAGFLSFWDAAREPDPGYMIANWLASELNGDVWVVNLICGALFSWGLFVFARMQPRPWLALVVAVPYLVIVVAMGYTRQGVAIGLAMIGFEALVRQRSLLKFILWIVLAATFHKTAVVLIPVALLTQDRGRVGAVVVVGISTIIAYYLLLDSSVQSLQTNYLATQYQSNGAGIRVAMNALPAAILLVFRKRFIMPRAEKRLWILFSLGALAMVPALIISPSSTAVDRFGLYLIPLQLTVLSRLPYAFAKTERDVSMIAIGVAVYSAAVQFVWLNYAQTAFAWVPYQLYPF